LCRALRLPGLALAQEESGSIVITAEEIRQMQANKMADILNHVPGVTAGDSSVGIHGSYKVKVLGMGQYQNFGEVSFKGCDLALTWQALRDLTLKASYTYLKATDEETGLMIPAKAEHQAILDCYWQVTDRLMTVVSGKYVSEVYRNKANTRTVPDYILANLRAEYSLENYSFFAEIKNLADTIYYYSDGLLAPPLTWMAGLSWKF
jgi:outer membrane receptor protein involved in Fe transport